MGQDFKWKTLWPQTAASTLLQGPEELAALPSHSPTHSLLYKHKPTFFVVVHSLSRVQLFAFL